MHYAEAHISMNYSQKYVEVLCAALVTYKLTIVYEIDNPSANHANLEKNVIRRRFGLSPSSGMVVRNGKNILKIAEIR